ncbi:hypothetical protein Ancab_025010, partial [Ancistrocladus abbreviatus]
NFYEGGGISHHGPFGEWSGEPVGLSEDRTKLSPLSEASSVSVQARPHYQASMSFPQDEGP